MKHLDSSIARLMMAVATVAVGLMAMKTQADAWLGSLATIVVGWFLLAMAEIVGGKGRSFWGGFLVAGLVSIAVSFGPWSDRDVRGGLARPPTTPQAWLDQLQPVSLGIYRLNTLFGRGFGARSKIVTFDLRHDKEQVVATVVAPGWNEDDLGLARTFSENLIRPSWIFGIPPRSRYTADEQAFDVALDAGHLLASFGFGTVAGLGLALIGRFKLRRVVVASDQEIA